MSPIEHLLKVLSEQGGHLVVDVKDGDQSKVVVAMEFGREAPDSPMAGGAAYGMADSVEAAVEQAARETGWKPAEPAKKLLRCFDSVGHEFVQWQVHTDTFSIGDAPREATNAIRDAHLVIFSDGDVHKAIKWRYGDPTTTDALAAIDVLRAMGTRVDDDRPRVDGTKCGHPIVAGDNETIESLCPLDRGHEGGHVPAEGP